MNIQLMNTLQDIRLQFKQDTSVEVKDAKIQGEKLIKIIKKQLKELKHHSESLYKDTESQLAKGKEKLSSTRKGGDYWRTVKMANEVGQVSMDEAEAIEIPDTISYESLRKLITELGPALTKTIKLKKRLNINNCHYLDDNRLPNINKEKVLWGGREGVRNIFR